MFIVSYRNARGTLCAVHRTASVELFQLDLDAHPPSCTFVHMFSPSSETTKEASDGSMVFKHMTVDAEGASDSEAAQGSQMVQEEANVGDANGAMNSMGDSDVENPGVLCIAVMVFLLRHDIVPCRHRCMAVWPSPSIPSSW